MHRDLILGWIRNQALLILPIAPHFAEHIWKEVLKEGSSVQAASFPEPSAPADQSAIEAGKYVHNLLSSIRSTEATFAKKKSKGKVTTGYDPSKPKGVRIFVAKDFPAWQANCVEAVKQVYNAETNEVDMAKVKSVLAEKGLAKEARALPFSVMFAVSTAMWKLLAQTADKFDV